MKKYHHISVAVIALFLFLGTGTLHAGNELETIRKQYAEAVLRESFSQDTLLADFVRYVEPEREVSDQGVQELLRLYPFDLEKIRSYLSRMKPDGSWTDIDYADKRRSGWAPRLHAERALELAKLYQSSSTSYYHSDSILNAYRMAVNFWAKAEIKCLNWWYNQIGMPKTLGDSYMLMLPEMTSEDLRGAVKVLSAASISGTGQNRVWLSGVVLVRAIIEQDTALAREARNAILEQVTLGNEEGIQPDWSFHQHGSQQQFGNYGLAFISDISFYSRVFRGTSFALSDMQQGLVENLLNQGYRWIIWHRYMDVGSLDRQLFHNAQSNKAYRVAFAAQNIGMGGFSRTGNQLVGHRHFDYSDYTLHRRPDWMASVKMASNRVIGTERVNEDNQLGFYMGDGATYFYVRGDEYDNVFPLWNWRMIPGTTTFGLDRGSMPKVGINDSQNHSDKVGGLTVGEAGMTAMELNRMGLHAKKAWLFTPRYVLCLGADIHADTTLAITTCIDQRNAVGSLKVLTGDSWTSVADKQSSKGETRFFHDQTGFIVCTPQVRASVSHRTGDWADNMGSYKNYPAEGTVMQMDLLHKDDKCTYSDDYRYLVVPGSTPDEVKDFNVKKEITVYQNDAQAQIVSVRSLPGLIWVAAYEPGCYKAGKREMVVEKPGIYAFDDAVGNAKRPLHGKPFITTEGKQTP